MTPGQDLNPLFRGQARRAERQRLRKPCKAAINIQLGQGLGGGLQRREIFGDAFQQAGIELFFERQ